eukprot:CAMPEP_0197890162 /NCGR_PEP_ID=MMETSP1439-20131203/25612_1 /TAXON_ID=66791 /ORGANISM="Gonyaulax spinifera, Strain CCMP409" /LENGTH=79 /DNA_ID=CAMNT_0043510171 /DNA_START=60 /DNA_END=299 /DNA_ORIENTATION=+
MRRLTSAWNSCFSEPSTILARSVSLKPSTTLSPAGSSAFSVAFSSSSARTEPQSWARRVARHRNLANGAIPVPSHSVAG